MYSDITGIILSGGRSSRMGENKSLMKVGSKTVIEYVTDLMKNLFSKVILITNDPDDYSFLGLNMYKDIYFRMGPLAGIHSGLTHSTSNKNFFLSCDMPFMTADMIKYLAEYKTSKPITIAKADGFIQQLCGLYDKSCLSEAEKILSEESIEDERIDEQKKRGCKVLTLVNTMDSKIIEAELLPFYKKDTFFNMNKRSDYEMVINKLNSHL
jgi:molybdopterin-guanine dinucleotide biosynthesis protein A